MLVPVFSDVVALLAESVNLIRELLSVMPGRMRVEAISSKRALALLWASRREAARSCSVCWVVSMVVIFGEDGWMIRPIND